MQLFIFFIYCARYFLPKYINTHMFVCLHRRWFYEFSLYDNVLPHRNIYAQKEWFFLNQQQSYLLYKHLDYKLYELDAPPRQQSIYCNISKTYQLLNNFVHLNRWKWNFKCNFKARMWIAMFNNYHYPNDSNA